MFQKILITLVTLLVTVSFCHGGDDPTVTAELNTNSISIEESALLTVTVVGSRSPEIIMPQVPGLTFYSRGTSTMINMINGDFTSSSTSKYIIQADQEGTYTIPPIGAEMKGNIYKSEPLAIVVTDNRTQQKGKAVSSSSKSEEVAFIEVNLGDEHYVGEQVPVTITGFFNSQYRISLESAPGLTGDGVIMAPFTEKPEQARAQVGGKVYDTVKWQTTLSAIKEGEHKIQLSLDAAVLTREQRSGNPFNDPFFDSFFNSTKKTPLDVTSKNLVFKALPLPQKGQPESFTGAVGNFTIHVEADPIIVDVGEPITITSTITGVGSFDSVHAPLFKESETWKTYKPATLEVGEQEKGTKKIFQQVIVPKEDNIEEVPPILFSFFNPETKKYQTSKSLPVAIHVKPAKSVTPVKQEVVKPEIASKDSKIEAEQSGKQAKLYNNLIPQHLETGKFYNAIEPVFFQRWFIATTIISIFLIVVFSLYHLYQHLRGNNPVKELRKQQKKLVNSSLTKLQTLLNTNEGDEFLAVAKNTVQQFYSLEFDLPEQAITGATLEEKLLKNSVSFRVLEAFDRSIFSGQKPEPSEMKEWLELMKEELAR